MAYSLPLTTSVVLASAFVLGAAIPARFELSRGVSPDLHFAQTQGTDRRQDRRGGRQDRRDDRQGDRTDRRDDRQDCRQAEGVGKDKRDCKQDERQERNQDG